MLGGDALVRVLKILVQNVLVVLAKVSNSKELGRLDTLVLVVCHLVEVPVGLHDMAFRILLEDLVEEGLHQEDSELVGRSDVGVPCLLLVCCLLQFAEGFE